MDEDEKGVVMYVDLSVRITSASWAKLEQLPNLHSILGLAQLSEANFGDAATMHGHLSDGTCFEAEITSDLSIYRDGNLEMQALSAETEAITDIIEDMDDTPSVVMDDSLASKAVH